MFNRETFLAIRAPLGLHNGAPCNPSLMNRIVPRLGLQASRRMAQACIVHSAKSIQSFHFMSPLGDLEA